MKESKTKIIKLYVIILMGSLVFLFFLFNFFYQLDTFRNIEKLKFKQKIILNLIKKDIEKEFVDYINDIRFLAETPQLKTLLYRKSDLKENENYLESYLEIKNKYFAGNIKNIRNNTVIESYKKSTPLKIKKTNFEKITKDITVYTYKQDKNEPIINIVAPILGKSDIYLGNVSLYKKQDYTKDVLKKYEHVDLISKNDFYWFSVDEKHQISDFERSENLENSNFIPNKFKQGSTIKKNILYTYDTLNLKEILPKIKFDKDTNYILKLVIKTSETKIEAIKSKFLHIYALLGITIYICFAIVLWIILKEIDKRKFYEKELKLRNKKLIEADITKDKFISILAHDLKSPFTGITGIFNMLTRKYDIYDEAKKKKLIFSLNDSIKGINTLLINLLEWSEISRNHVIYSPIKIKVNDVIQQAYEILKLNLEGKNIKFINNVSNKHFVWVDKNMVEAIFRNILSNAIKFTPNFGEIKCSCKKEGDYIVVYIEDNGVGMSLEVQSRLFKFDEHLTNLGTNNEKGTGLGLVIAKEFIHINKGILEVDSIKDEGTTFIIKLPISN